MSSPCNSAPPPHHDGSRLRINHVNKEHTPLYFALVLIGLAGIGAYAIGVAALGAHQAIWSIGAFSQLGQVNAIILMAAGGGSVLFVAGVVLSVQKYTDKGNQRHREEVQNLVRNLRREHRAAPEQSQDSETALAQLRAEHEREKERLRSELQEANREEISLLENRYEALQSEKDHLEREITRMQESLNRVNRLLNEQKTLSDQKIKELLQEKTNYEHTIANLQASVQKLYQLKERHEQEKTELQTQLREYKARVQQNAHIGGFESVIETPELMNFMNKNPQALRSQRVYTENDDDPASGSQASDDDPTSGSQDSDKENGFHTEYPADDLKDSFVFINSANDTELKIVDELKTAILRTFSHSLSEDEQEVLEQFKNFDRLDNNKKQDLNLFAHLNESETEKLCIEIANILKQYRGARSCDWNLINVEKIEKRFLDQENKMQFDEEAIRHQIVKDFGRQTLIKFRLIKNIITDPAENNGTPESIDFPSEKTSAEIATEKAYDHIKAQLLNHHPLIRNEQEALKVLASFQQGISGDCLEFLYMKSDPEKTSLMQKFFTDNVLFLVPKTRSLQLNLSDPHKIVIQCKDPHNLIRTLDQQRKSFAKIYATTKITYQRSDNGLSATGRIKCFAE